MYVCIGLVIVSLIKVKLVFFFFLSLWSDVFWYVNDIICIYNGIIRNYFFNIFIFLFVFLILN